MSFLLDILYLKIDYDPALIAILNDMQFFNIDVFTPNLAAAN